IPPSFFEPPTTRSGSVSDSAEFSLLLGDSQIAVAAPPVPQSPPAAPTDAVVRSASVSSLEFVNIPSGFFDRVEEDERAIELEAAPDPEAQVPAAQVPAAQRTEASGPQGAADSGAQSSGTYRAAKFAKGVEGARK